MRWRAGIRTGIAAAAIAWCVRSGTRGAEKPQYGGVLRVELRATSVTLNPAQWKPGAPENATNERLAALLFDRLVALDNYGRFQPRLAIEWSHDAAARHWQFVLRPGMKFSDGSLLTPADVVAALRAVLPRGMQILASPNGVAIQSANSTNDLLELLASGPTFVYKDNGTGGLVGTGAFTLESTNGGNAGADPAGSAAAAQHLRFRFNEECWSGRPFLDGVDVTLGVAPLKALLDVQLGRADIGELSEDTARRAGQASLKLWTSAAITLYALRFATAASTENDRNFREVLRLSLDRNAMARVLLQREAEPAASFLPQWLSGYAFFFETESDLERAKKLRAGLPANTQGVAQPLRVGLESGNDLLKLIGERVVVNARAAGLTLQLAQKAAGKNTPDGAKADGEPQLVAWRYGSLAPREALQEAAAAWKLANGEGSVPEEADARYAWETRMMDGLQVIPLVAVPDFAALDGRVRNWSAAPWGEWRLADAWLAAADKGTKSTAGAKP